MKHLLIRILANLRNLLYYLKFYCMSLFCKPSKNYILFDAFTGAGFNDNPKTIFDSLQEYNLNLIWVFKNDEMITLFNENFPQFIAIKYNSIQHYYYLNKSAFWIFNYKTPPYFIKRKGTTFIQTWHGIPLKKLGCDIVDNGQTFYRSQQSYQQMIQSYINEGEKCTYFITPSNYAKDKLTSAFKLDDNKTLEIGYPRNILLQNHTENLVTNIKNDLKITKKVILYAPTWRDDNANLINGYKNDFLLDFKKLYENFHDEYQLLYRPHYLINESLNLDKYGDFIVDVGEYPDINELHIISDILITDYSSVYFDYSILERPIYFYMPDLAHYQDVLRGFYIDINSELPNDYYTNDDDLIYAIKESKINLVKQESFYITNHSFPIDMNEIKNIILNS